MCLLAIKGPYSNGKTVVAATEYLVLVDEHDRMIGQAEKLLAHQQNLLHRAFSVFIFRDDYLLLQQRSFAKYHSPGLWTNACCSHPRPDESILNAGIRRVQEELGITTELTSAGIFHYNAHFDNGLSENEIDHVLVGQLDATVEPIPNEEEVHTIKWITIPELRSELQTHPTQFTPWFAQALDIALSQIRLTA